MRNSVQAGFVRKLLNAAVEMRLAREPRQRESNEHFTLGSDTQLRHARPWIPAEPLAFSLLLFSGWINRQPQDVIEYLLEENRVLRAAYGSHRIRITDDQRRRLA